MATRVPPRVFISYSHDSPVHRDRVLELSNRLRSEGIDCVIDQYEESPPEGWPAWCMNQVKWSEFVLVVCTEIYKRRFSGKEEPGRGRGVTFEGYVITQFIYEEYSRNKKFVPLIFSAAEAAHVPTSLKGSSIYDLSELKGYEDLYRRLTKQPPVTKPPLGKPRAMPPRTATAPSSLPKLQRKQEFLAPVWNVPLSPNPFFTGRETILEKIQKKFASSKRVALSGMRGVGKTQIAARYADLHRKEYQDVLWARAESRDTLIGDFASTARLLDLPQKDEKDQSVIVDAMKRWLEATSGWLLVLDNADDLALVRELVPPTHAGHLLLTTTAQALGGLAEKVPVDEMDLDEGALLLLRRAGVIDREAPLKEATDADRTLARELAKELDGLPLALDQAGAFIEETPAYLAEYSKLYNQEGKRLRHQRGELSTDHPSVTVTFSLAFGELAKRDPIAADLVRLCAFLAPDAIPEEVFTKGGSAIGEEFAKRVENPFDLAEVIKQAAKFSLIRRDAPDRSLDIHRVVQEVLKDEMDMTQLREWAERAVRATNLAFPRVEFRTWPDCERLMPHAKACASLIETFSLSFEDAGRLLYVTAFYMKARAQYKEAESLYKRSLAIYERALGPDHPLVANNINNLAVLYRRQGRYAEAEALYQRAMMIDEKALGPDHPDLATDLNNLALLYQRQGRYAEAEPLHKRSLAIREKALGSDHSLVANSLNNLATLYDDQGQYAEAESLYRRAFAIDEKALGPDHPDLATDLNNLAALYDHQGRYAEAEALYQRAMMIDEKALGPDHPDLATDLNNLALLYQSQGRYAEAEPLHKRSLAIKEMAFGPDHPDVALSLNNLAALYVDKERYAEAEPLFKRSLAIREKTLGPNHPSMATALENYAALLRKTGREAEAQRLEARAKAIRENAKAQAGT